MTRPLRYLSVCSGIEAASKVVGKTALVSGDHG